jgi:hypothetical protein
LSKLVVCLRILGRGHDFDTVNEISLVPTSTCHYVFKKFVARFAEIFFDRYVHMPVGNDLKKVMETYKMMGFNGAIGSIDCTHHKWSKCPVSMQNFCIGKEKYATVSFQCVVDHDKRVRLVSKIFWGAANNKEIVRNVPETLDIINGKYEDVTFTLYDEIIRGLWSRGLCQRCLLDCRRRIFKNRCLYGSKSSKMGIGRS